MILRVEQAEDGKSLVVHTPTCIECGKPGTVIIPEKMKEKFFAWANGDGFIQNQLPYLSSDDREMLLSGIHGECWHKLNAGFDDE